MGCAVSPPDRDTSPKDGMRLFGGLAGFVRSFAEISVELLFRTLTA